NALDPSKAAREAAAKSESAISAIKDGKPPRTKSAKALIAACSAGVPIFGDPARDWLRARDVLEQADLAHVFAEARMMRFFRARDEVGAALAAMWLDTGGYGGAVKAVRQALDRQLLVSAESDPRGCILMSMHKSKGKEFDGVVLIEGLYAGLFFGAHEAP